MYLFRNIVERNEGMSRVDNLGNLNYNKIKEDLIEYWYIYLIGYVYAIAGGFILIKKVINTMWKEIGWTGEPSSDSFRTYAWHSSAVGCIEIILYVTSWLVGLPHFIAIWLALKTAPSWGAWTDLCDAYGKKVQGRTIFNIFLLGNALSILFGSTGAGLIKWAIEGQYDKAITLPLILIVVTIIFWIWASYRLKETQKK